jgi:hypothetical protein
MLKNWGFFVNQLKMACIADEKIGIYCHKILKMHFFKKSAGILIFLAFLSVETQEMLQKAK